MSNSKVKNKHRKRKEREKRKQVLEIGNAKKKTLRKMSELGSLPSVYEDRIK